GFILPWILGYVVTIYFGFGGYEAFFVGVILTATSIGITMSILQELQMASRSFARIILGAAVIDDILGLVALSLTITIVQAGTVSIAEIMWIAFFSVGTIVVAVIIGIKLLSLVRTFSQKNLSEGALYLLIISLALLASVLAEDIGLSAIVGAFLAGLVITEAKFYREYAKLHETLDPLVALFSPIFFLQIGLLINREDLLAGIYLGLVLTLVAIIGKYLGCYYASRSTKINYLDSMLISFGMLPRGEVALVAAQIGLSFAIISPGVLSAVVVMSLLTSIIPPILFLYILSPYRAVTPEEFEVERKKVEEQFSIILRLRKHLAKKMPRKRTKK
ncbi:MAG: cation:proton antiporter, partial [Candidatus Hodarchaeota archaeon]